MAVNNVDACGVVFRLGEDGYYQVQAWVRLRGSMGAATTEYDGLTWPEAQDVAAEHVTAHRPGWAVGDGWRQPPLFGPGTD